MLASVEPFVVAVVVEILKLGEARHIPLTGHNAALGGTETSPHAVVVDEGVGAGVGGAEGLVFVGAPVGNETPFHGVKNALIVVSAKNRGL